MQAETAVTYAVLSGCCCLLPADMEKVEIHQSHSGRSLVCMCVCVYSHSCGGARWSWYFKECFGLFVCLFFFKHWCVQVSVYVYGMHACIYIVLWYVECFFSVEANPYIKILSFLLPPLATNLRSSDSYSLIALGKRKQTDFEPRFPLHWPTSAQQKN